MPSPRFVWSTPIIRNKDPKARSAIRPALMKRTAVPGLTVLSHADIITTCSSKGVAMGEVFDGKRAFEHIEKLSAIKRLPGTPGETQAQEYIKGVGDDIVGCLCAGRSSPTRAPLSR